MDATVDEIVRHLQPLVGLNLSIARRAADMRVLHFGPIRADGDGTVGEYALHIQCPWRVEDAEGILTGKSDLWRPAIVGPDFDWDSWDYETSQSLQDKHMESLLGGYDPRTRSAVNPRNDLVVETVQGDACGGAVITLSGGYRLILFPAGSAGEDWRIFRPATNEPHFVVTGGRIAEDT